MSDTATTAINKLRGDLLGIIGGTIFHVGADTPISTADATDEASLLTLVNELSTSFDAHVPNTVDPTAGTGVHAADSGERLGATAVDIGTASTALTNLNRLFRIHASNASAHFRADELPELMFAAGGAITMVAVLCSRANALKAAMNGHYAAAMNSGVAS
jgi:hypothetical protein